MARHRRLFLYLLSMALALAVAALAALEVPILQRMELSARDTLSLLGRKTPANEKLIFLAIDNASITVEAEEDLRELFGITDDGTPEAQALRMMSEGWPWPRSVYALILDRLIGAGARGVIFDLNFPTASEADEPFRAALERHRGKVAIGSNFVSGSESIAGTERTIYTGPSTTLIPEAEDDRVGYANFWPDLDGIIREARLAVTFTQLSGLDAGDDTPFYSLGARGLQISGRGDLAASMEPQIIRMTAPPLAGFPPRSIYEIFVPDYWRQNFRSGTVFKDALVMVGAAGNWQHDEHRTSLGLMPGPELQLNALNAFLHNELLHPLSRSRSFALTLLGGALAIALGRACSSPSLRLLLLGLCAAAWTGLALLFFDAGTLIPVVPPLLALGLNGFIGVVHDVSRERLERSRLRRTLERYVSKNVVHEVLDHPQEYMASLGGAVRPVTVLFSDIRDYSVLSVTSDPHALVAQLNEYLTAMVDCVFRHGGTLDKFIGDAVMAVWGNAQTLGAREDTLSATRAAFAMREELDKLNARWRATGRPELAIGIAVNHGDVIVGNIGSPQRMEYTVIGDAVNLTWRLQELTKRLPFALLVGKSAASFIGEHFEVQSLGTHEVSGQPEPVEVFGVAGEVTVGEPRPRSAHTSAG